MIKKIGERNIREVEKLTSGYSLLKSIAPKHLIERDRKLLMKRLDIYKYKIRRIIDKDLENINKNLAREGKSKSGSLGLVKVINESLIELNERERVLKAQVKKIGNIKRIISNRRSLLNKKIKKLDSSLKTGRVSKRFMKKSKLKVK